MDYTPSRFAFVVALLLFFSPAIISQSGHADGDFATDQQKTGAEKVGADASVADKRLPPVFPGEEIHDGNNTIKVWSTSGGVAGSEMVAPQQNNYPSGNEGLGGVIVDGRPDGNSNRNSGTSNSNRTNNSNAR